MKNLRVLFLRFGGLLPILALATAAATAAENPPPSGRAAGPEPAPTEVVRRPTSFNFDFAGGTVGDLIAALHKNDAEFNLIAEPQCAKLMVPPFSIRNTDRIALGCALQQLLRPQNAELTQSGGPSGNFVWVIRAQPPAPTSKAPENGIQCFQLGPYLERYQVDDIVSAIRTAWTLDSTNPPEALQLKYHPATRLLIVVGPPKAITVAFGVVGALESKHESKPAPAPAAKTSY